MKNGWNILHIIGITYFAYFANIGIVLCTNTIQAWLKYSGLAIIWSRAKLIFEHLDNELYVHYLKTFYQRCGLTNRFLKNYQGWDQDISWLVVFTALCLITAYTNYLRLKDSLVK